MWVPGLGCAWLDVVGGLDSIGSVRVGPVLDFLFGALVPDLGEFAVAAVVWARGQVGVGADSVRAGGFNGWAWLGTLWKNARV